MVSEAVSSHQVQKKKLSSSQQQQQLNAPANKNTMATFFKSDKPVKENAAKTADINKELEDEALSLVLFEQVCDMTLLS